MSGGMAKVSEMSVEALTFEEIESKYQVLTEVQIKEMEKECNAKYGSNFHVEESMVLLTQKLGLTATIETDAKQHWVARLFWQAYEFGRKDLNLDEKQVQIVLAMVNSILKGITVEGLGMDAVRRIQSTLQAEVNAVNADKEEETQKEKEEDPKNKHLFSNECLAYIESFVLNVFGNYLVARLIEVAFSIPPQEQLYRATYPLQIPVVVHQSQAAGDANNTKGSDVSLDIPSGLSPLREALDDKTISQLSQTTKGIRLCPTPPPNN